MISAILRAQLLSMRPRLATGRGGAVFSVITSLFFYGFWAFIAWGGMLFFSAPDDAGVFVPALAGGLMLAMAYWQLAPLISASFGASLDLHKLLAYPIPHSKLFLVEVLLRVATCGEMLLVVGGAAVGLLRNPAYGGHATPQILAGAFTFIAMNILLSAGTRNWLERIFLRTKLKEVAIFLFVVIGLAPRLLLSLHVKQAAIFRFVPSQAVWPWAGAARLMLADSLGIGVLSALAWLLASFLFSRWQFERSIRYDTASTRTASSVRLRPEAAPGGITERIFRFPSRLLPDPVGGLAEKELRTLARIPRFRLVYAMSAFFGIVLYFPNMKHVRPDSFFSEHAVLFMATYGLLMLGQITYWNSFGFDRSAVQAYFSFPIPFRDVLVAKNLAVVLLMIPQIMMVSLIALAAHIPISAGKVGETTVVMLITALYWLAMGNIFSVRIPRALDPDKMNQMSNKMQALTMLGAPFLLLPLVLAYWSRWFFESQLVFVALILFSAAIGGVFYWVGLDSAVNIANRRREAILTELSRSDGPLSIT